MAPIDPEDLTPDQRLEIAKRDLAYEHERELYKVKVSATITAMPTALALGWGLLYSLHFMRAPDDWLIGIVSSIIAAGSTKLVTALLAMRFAKKQQEKDKV